MFLTWRAVVLTAVGVPIAIAASSALPAVMWFALVVIAVGIDAAAAPSPRLVATRRETPTSVRLTEATATTLLVRNMGSRRMRGWARDAWQPSAGADAARHRLDLAPGDGVRLRTPMRPTRRGDRQAGPVTLRLLGPLSLAGRQLTVPLPATLRVLPEFASRKHLPSRMARLRELDGRSAVQQRGPGSEFDSLREYVIGDDVRAIDWRATARRNEVVVRTWRPERDRQVLILIDTARSAAARIGETPRLDAAIEAALLLSALASKAGDRVHVVAFDRAVRARVSGVSGAALMPAIADRVAPLEPRLVEPDWTAAAGVVREMLGQRALVVLLTDVGPGSVDSGLLRALAPLARDHQVLIGAVDDPEIAALVTERGDTVELYTAAAATRFELERDAVAERLRRRGVEVVSSDPDGIAPAVADAYLALKAAGKL
ncbi:DUF58 domain-containing protein [Demequina zhanjiangensis]|uniref:DUF58 domain-containing protein n=1 Tax=Demequina zhanjiangensis TaxID=3051659 RepID=A0ABT8FXP4_9MICO|nr:DUF58 domain-containing protein [Demequina sp. SYSU T00b26]MDN4471683.1 DUF58 domain-containing protein [Demequina sp. SYSU T00b26]